MEAPTEGKKTDLFSLLNNEHSGRLRLPRRKGILPSTAFVERSAIGIVNAQNEIDTPGLFHVYLLLVLPFLLSFRRLRHHLWRLFNLSLATDISGLLIGAPLTT